MTSTVGNKQVLFATLGYKPDETACGLLWSFALALANEAGFQVVGTDRQNYERQGETLIVYLAESHIAIETYPEHNLFELEIVSCKPFPGECVALVAGEFDYSLKGMTILTKTKRNTWRRC